jgi:hypothetical protein
MKSERETFIHSSVADVLTFVKLRIVCKAFSPSNICRYAPSLPLDVWYCRSFSINSFPCMHTHLDTRLVVCTRQHMNMQARRTQDTGQNMQGHAKLLMCKDTCRCMQSIQSVHTHAELPMQANTRRYMPSPRYAPTDRVVLSTFDTHMYATPFVQHMRIHSQPWWQNMKIPTLQLIHVNKCRYALSLQCVQTHAETQSALDTCRHVQGHTQP